MRKTRYYQSNHLRTGGKVIRELHKITSVRKNQVKPWLEKQALQQIHIPPPKGINHPHYDGKKPNEQHQLDVLYESHKDLLYKAHNSITD